MRAYSQRNSTYPKKLKNKNLQISSKFFLNGLTITLLLSLSPGECNEGKKEDKEIQFFKDRNRYRGKKIT